MLGITVKAEGKEEPVWKKILPFNKDHMTKCLGFWLEYSNTPIRLHCQVPQVILETERILMSPFHHKLALHFRILGETFLTIFLCPRVELLVYITYSA